MHSAVTHVVQLRRKRDYKSILFSKVPVWAKENVMDVRMRFLGIVTMLQIISEYAEPILSIQQIHRL